MPTILGEVSVRGEQTDCVGALARPTVDSTLTLLRTARAGVETVRAKSTADGRFAAAEALRDVLRGKALVYVQPREVLRIDRRLHQDTVALLFVLVNRVTLWTLGAVPASGPGVG